MTSRTDGDPPKPIPMKKAEFGRRVGRARSSVTEACAGALAAACLHGGRIDVAHSAVSKWCKDRGIDPAVLLETSPAAAQAKRTARPRSTSLPTADKRKRPAQENEQSGHARSVPLQGLLDLTLRQITDRFGSEQGFADFLDQRKKLADTLARELQLDRDRNLLVPRAFIETHIFGLIDGAWRRLLQDMPFPLCNEIYGLAKTGAPIEDAISAAQRAITSQLQHVTSRAQKSFRAAGKFKIANERRAETGGRPNEQGQYDS